MGQKGRNQIATRDLYKLMSLCFIGQKQLISSSSMLNKHGKISNAWRVDELFTALTGVARYLVSSTSITKSVQKRE